MTLFFISAAALVVVCLLWLLVGLFRQKSADTDQEAVNITLAREKRATLDAALADGAIDQDTYDHEREQLELDLANELRLDEASRKKPRDGRMAAAVLVTLFVPITAGALYLRLGNPGAIIDAHTMPQRATNAAGNPNGQGSDQVPSLAELLPQLEERLKASPDDIDGWRLLGRSYLSVGAYPQAQAAFESALKLNEDDVATLALVAESMAMSREGSLVGEPMNLLKRANAIDPQHEHTLWLMSIGQQQVGDHDAALAGFNRLAAVAQDNPEALAAIEEMRSVSIQAMAGNAISLNQQGTPNATQADASAATTQNTDEAAAESVAASVNVSVSLGENLPEDLNPDHAVFIYAKASKGPPMPLAVSRVTVRDLPLSVTLDDSMAMIPTMTLSGFDPVIIGARVSASGNPVAQSGDWATESAPISVSNTPTVSLVIDTQTP